MDEFYKKQPTENDRLLNQKMAEQMQDDKDTRPLGKKSSSGSSSAVPIDTYDEFKNKVRQFSDEEKMPAFQTSKTYQLYLWKQKKCVIELHHSIVIGCKEMDGKLDDIGFITMELCVDQNKNKIYPKTVFITKGKGTEHIEKKDWERPNQGSNWDWQVRTTLNDLMNLAIELIKNHKTYIPLGNSCQDFA